MSPSFLIHELIDKSAQRSPKWDSFNSKYAIEKARQIYSKYLSTAIGSIHPKGVVIDQTHGNGRVVKAMPPLLPQEIFLGLDKIYPKRVKR